MAAETIHVTREGREWCSSGRRMVFDLQAADELQAQAITGLHRWLKHSAMKLGAAGATASLSIIRGRRWRPA